MSAPLRSHVRTVAGLFFSFAVCQAVLACAIWRFHLYATQQNVIYGSGVLSGFIFHCSLIVALLIGCKRNAPSLLTPYLVCSFIYFVLSFLASFYFLFCTAHGVLLGTDLVEIYGLILFTALTYFFHWSFRVIRTEKELVAGLAGKHLPFVNEEYI